MRRFIEAILFLAAALSVASCKEPVLEEPEKETGEAAVEFNITASDFLSLSGGWTRDDAVCVLDGESALKFSASADGKKVSFTSETGACEGKRTFIYPYSEDYSCGADEFSLALPSSQSPGDRTILACAARSSGSSVSMSDVFSLVRFSLGEDGISCLKFVSGDTLSLAGTATVGFNSAGYPVVESAEGLSEITLRPESGTFEKGKVYTFAALPCGNPDSLLVIRDSSELYLSSVKVPCSSLQKGGVADLGEISFELPAEPEAPEEGALDIDLVFIQGEESTFLWPFAIPSVSTISATYKDGQASYPGVETLLIMPYSSGGYTFKIFGTTGVAKNAGGRQGLKFGGASGDYLEFPAIPEHCLTKVMVVSGGSGGNGNLTVVGADGSYVAGGSAISSFAEAGESFEWTLGNTVIGAAYRLCVNGASSAMLREIHLHYSASPVVYEDPAEFFKGQASDTIPDFSRVGYHYGDREIPDVPVDITLEAPADGSDALAMINDAIAKVKTPGAILLKAGTYNVSASIRIARDGVVLRGEGEGKTVLYCTATTQITNVVQIGNADAKEISPTCSDIVAEYVPAGQMWVPVRDPSVFAVGDKVFVYRKATNEWLDAIHMREIPTSGSDGVTQWTESAYSIYWERKITAIDGYKIYLDNPIVMGIGGFGTSGLLYKGSWTRVQECGLENLTIDTRYDETQKSGSDYIDELHAWSGVTVRAAENCWVRNVTTKHIGYCSVDLGTGAYKVTVDNCTGLVPVSQVTGSRRYAFHFSGSQACLIENCSCDDDRHQYVCGARVPGPNVFYNCKATKTRSEAGPHQRWTTGVLYDNVKVDGSLNIHDRAQYGTGHGWTSATVVLYNCEASSIVCQSPWTSAKNWAIGCIGAHKAAARTYNDNLGARPDGEWISEGVHVQPTSLYLDQLEKRHNDGVWLEK